MGHMRWNPKCEAKAYALVLLHLRWFVCHDA